MDENSQVSIPDGIATTERHCLCSKDWEMLEQSLMHRDISECNVFQTDEEQNWALWVDYSLKVVHSIDLDFYQFDLKVHRKSPMFDTEFQRIFFL